MHKFWGRGCGDICRDCSVFCVKKKKTFWLMKLWIAQINSIMNFKFHCSKGKKSQQPPAICYFSTCAFGLMDPGDAYLVITPSSISRTVLFCRSSGFVVRALPSLSIRDLLLKDHAQSSSLSQNPFQ